MAIVPGAAFLAAALGAQPFVRAPEAAASSASVGYPDGAAENVAFQNDVEASLLGGR